MWYRGAMGIHHLPGNRCSWGLEMMRIGWNLSLLHRCVNGSTRQSDRDLNPRGFIDWSLNGKHAVQTPGSLLHVAQGTNEGLSKAAIEEGQDKLHTQVTRESVLII